MYFIHIYIYIQIKIWWKKRLFNLLNYFWKFNIKKAISNWQKPYERRLSTFPQFFLIEIASEKDRSYYCLLSRDQRLDIYSERKWKARQIDTEICLDKEISPERILFWRIAHLYHLYIFLPFLKPLVSRKQFKLFFAELYVFSLTI